jgi:hypothetical protein
MSFKTISIMSIMLFVTAGLALPGFALDPPGPPLATGIDEKYYEGIWLINITERCHRHTDGGVVNLGTERLYMRVSFNGGPDYIGDLYPTLEDARNETNLVGIWDFSFDFPGFGETYVVNGFGDMDVDNANFSGVCDYGFEAWLKTAVKLSANQKLSKLTGSNIAFCFPDLPEDPYLTCSSNWNARWVEASP